MQIGAHFGESLYSLPKDYAREAIDGAKSMCSIPTSGTIMVFAVPRSELDFVVKQTFVKIPYWRVLAKFGAFLVGCVPRLPHRVSQSWLPLKNADRAGVCVSDAMASISLSRSA